jgi:hypothetical protein
LAAIINLGKFNELCPKGIIEIKPNKKAIKTCLDRGLSTEVIKLR